jgi:CDI immunity proteins
VSLDTTRPLEELEGISWGEPTYSSYVVVTYHRIRKKRLFDLTNEELRLGISQQMSLPYLLPIALERLSKDPFVAGDFYPGDLMASVLRVPNEALIGRPEWVVAIKRIAAEFFAVSSQQDGSWRETILPILSEAQARFTENFP